MGTTLPPLSPSEQAALARLAQCNDIEETVARPLAVEQLTSVGFDANEARDLCEQLRRYGYLYEADTGLRLTPGYDQGLRGHHSRS
jgi:hypothetical protein